MKPSSSTESTHPRSVAKRLLRVSLAISLAISQSCGATTSSAARHSPDPDTEINGALSGPCVNRCREDAAQATLRGERARFRQCLKRCNKGSLGF